MYLNSHIVRQCTLFYINTKHSISHLLLVLLKKIKKNKKKESDAKSEEDYLDSAMSIPLEDILSQPAKAHIKSSMEPTGFQPIQQTGGKNLKNRRRLQIMHDTLRQSLKPSGDGIFTYFQREAEKKEDASCIFLLWGSDSSESSATWAVDVPITHLESEDQIFQELTDRYAAERSFLRRHFSFRKFGKVKPVTVCSKELLIYPFILT